MTTIVGVCKNGNVTLGADSQVTDDDRRNNSLIMEKITKNNGYLLPFELISMLLLAAMIGCIVIAMKSKDKDATTFQNNIQ